MIVRMHSETVFFLSGITRAVIRIGTNEWPSTRPDSRAAKGGNPKISGIVFFSLDYSSLGCM